MIHSEVCIWLNRKCIQVDSCLNQDYPKVQSLFTFSTILNLSTLHLMMCEIWGIKQGIEELRCNYQY